MGKIWDLNPTETLLLMTRVAYDHDSVLEVGGQPSPIAVVALLSSLL